MKDNKIINRIVLFVFVCILFFTLYNSYNKSTEINYEDLYASSSEILVSNPNKTNASIDKYSFYIPQGYSLEQNSTILVEDNKFIQIIPEKINLNSQTYEINANEEILFQQGINGSQLIMTIWKVDNSYEVLMTDENGISIVGNFLKRDLEEGIIDMAEVLNSITIKEKNDNKQFL